MKPKDPIWNFYIVSGEGKTLKTTCKECKKDISAKSDRMKAHREKCPSLAPTLSKKRPLQAPEITELCSTVTPSKKQRLTQPSVSSYGVATSSSDKDQLDLQIAKLFFACNIPFNVAEHAVFKDTIEMLRPGYSAPNRKDIGGSLLDSVHDKLLTNMKTELAGKDVVMMQDGWSDIHNHPVIATSLHTDGTAYFLSALDTGANKKNASYCTDVAHDAIKEAESFGCHVTGVVTDNEKKMEVMKKNLKESDPNLTVYGCGSHWANLLGDDVTPSNIIKHVTDINKYFRNHHQVGALLRENQNAVKPQIPMDTRWNSNMRCIETYIRNRPYMQMLLIENEDLVDVRIRNSIQNVGLFNEVKNLYAQLKPIATSLDKLQSDSATLADACEIWMDLLENPDLQPHRATVQKRFNQAMTAEHYLANILHPVYRGKKLQPDHESSAQEYLLQKNPDLVPDFLTFMSNSVSLPKALICESVVAKTTPKVWWSCVERSETVNKSLCELATRLLIMPASSASLERVFSNFGLVQTKLRNRLGLEKAAKLVFCYRFLRGSCDIDW